MIKVFISQPMNGKTNGEIESERAAAVARIKEIYNDEVEVIDSFFKDAPHEAKPLWFLGKSIELLSTADVAVFCRGWEQRRGCIIEQNCCIQYGIKTLYI